MIRFISFEINHFAVFRRAHIYLSLDREARPLTVVRGENQSGKTTLMRALCWALFGSPGLGPIRGEVHPIRSVGAGRAEESKARVEILFENQTSDQVNRYRLVRSATTRPRADDLGFESFDELATLTEVNIRGAVLKEIPHPETRIKDIFPFAMKDFYFVDADKAEEYVGGGGQVNPAAMHEAVTSAIDSLLGLAELAQVQRRLKQAENGYLTKAASDSANLKKQELGKKLSAANTRLAELERLRQQGERDLEGATSRREQTKRQLDDSFANAGEQNAARKEYASAEQAVLNAKERAQQLAHRLVEVMNAPDFFKEIAWPIYGDITKRLDELKDAGFIPVQELGVCKRLLEQRECLCGARLDQSNPEGVRAVTSKLQRIESSAVEGAKLLDQALELARHELHSRRDRSTIMQLRELQTKTSAVREELADADAILAEVKERFKDIDENSSRLIYELVEETKASEAKIKHSLEQVTDQLKDLKSEIDGLKRKLKAEQKKEEMGSHAETCAMICEVLGDAISEAYETLETSRLKDVSDAMNEIYQTVTNSAEHALDRQVGVRALKINDARRYELFAEGQDGSDKALTLLNGAARRTLGLSFVLALAGALGEDLPLVADSLLHATSGETHSRLLDYLTDGKRVTQPILFGTGQDFSDTRTRELLGRRAGRTYTLTSQSQVGDRVVRSDPDRHSPFESTVCECSPSQYCNLCERKEWDLTRMERRQ